MAKLQSISEETKTKNESEIFNKVINQLKFELKEQEDYVNEIKTDTKYEKDILIENLGIKEFFRIDMDTLTEENKKEIRKNYRKTDTIYDSEIKESKKLENTLLIADRLIESFTHNNFKSVLKLLREGSELFNLTSLKLFLPNQYDEIMKLFESNDNLNNFVKMIVNDDEKSDEKYLEALKNISIDDWFLASITPTKIPLVLHRAIYFSLCPYSHDATEEFNFLFMNTNRITMLLEHVPFDVWFCPWYVTMSGYNPIQYLTNMLKPIFVENLFLRKKLSNIINQYKTSWGEKYKVKFIRARVPKNVLYQTSSPAPSLEMYFNETKINSGTQCDVVNMDDWNWITNKSIHVE